MAPSDPYSDFNNSDQTVIRPSPHGRRQTGPAIQTIGSDASGMIEGDVRQYMPEGDNPLVGGAVSLLSLVPKLRTTPYYNTIDVLRERLVAEMKTYEQQALKKGIARNQVDMAKYFLCSLLDETVLNTPWGSQSGWGHNSLSSLFYRKIAGGEEFFQILYRLRQNPSQNKHLLELGYYCLSMGFKGKYRYINNGLFTLEKQRQELHKALREIKGESAAALSIHWQGLQTRRNPLMRHVPLWVLGVLAGVILMGVYMFLNVSMDKRSDQIYEALIAMGQNVENTLPSRLAHSVKTQRPPTSLTEHLKQLLADEISRRQAAVINGSILRIFNMYPSGSATVKKEYEPMLSKIAGALQAENVQLTIVGHTDSTRIKFASRFKSNWHLSMARAESIVAALHRSGFATDAMRSEAMADKDPIAPNDTAKNRALNRRIDIYIR